MGHGQGLRMEVVSSPGLLLALGPGASGLSFSDNTTHLRGTDQGLESNLSGFAPAPSPTSSQILSKLLNSPP